MQESLGCHLISRGSDWVADCVSNTDAGDEAIAFFINGSENTENTDELLERENQLTLRIGKQYFYDRTTDIKTFNHPGVFKEFLENVKKEYEAYIEKLRAED